MAIRLANFASATKSSILKWSLDGIEFVKRMAVLAVGFRAHLLNPTTIRILTSSDNAKVLWINATRIPAHVIHCHFALDFANEDFVRNTMSHRVCILSSLAAVNPAIPALVLEAEPFPAIGVPVKLDLFCKSFYQRFRDASRNLLVSLVKLPAPLLPIRNALFFREFGPRLNLQFVNLHRLTNDILGPIIPLAILAMRKQIEMVRVYASSVSAGVVNLCSMWNNAVEYLKGHAVCVRTRAGAGLKFTVTLHGNVCRPIPASCFTVQFKLLHETVKQWSIGWHKSLLGWLNGRKGGIGINLIHAPLLFSPVSREPHDHLTQHFIKRDNMTRAKLGDEFADKFMIKANVSDGFWNPIHPRVVISFIHRQKPTRAPKVKSANERPQSGHELENRLFSFFLRLLQSRALTLQNAV